VKSKGKKAPKTKTTKAKAAQAAPQVADPKPADPQPQAQAEPQAAVQPVAPQPPVAAAAPAVPQQQTPAVAPAAVVVTPPPQPAQAGAAPVVPVVPIIPIVPGKAPSGDTEKKKGRRKAGGQGLFTSKVPFNHLKRVWEAYDKGEKFTKIEGRMGLRPNNGKTAWYVCQKYAKMEGLQFPKAGRERSRGSGKGVRKGKKK
jgi:hypothetical protein